jgi:hypothetical protein
MFVRLMRNRFSRRSAILENNQNAVIPSPLLRVRNVSSIENLRGIPHSARNDGTFLATVKYSSSQISITVWGREFLGNKSAKVRLV